MNLHALRVFYEVARQGGVTKAAEALHISQPAVSVQLRNLEKELGLALLAPHGRGVLLTEAGEMLRAEAGRLFSLEREIERRAADFAAGRAGKLRIAATYLPANFLLPGWLIRYRSAYPDVELEAVTTNARQAYDKLLSYEADLALVGGAGQAAEISGVVRETVLADEVWFVVPRGHRLAGRHAALAELLREPFVMRHAGSSMQELLLSICRLHRLPPPPAALRLGGQNETIRAVAAGFGACLSSALEVRTEVERGDIARVFVDAETPTNPIALCRRADDPLPAAAAAFAALARGGPAE